MAAVALMVATIGTVAYNQLNDAGFEPYPMNTERGATTETSDISTAYNAGNYADAIALIEATEGWEGDEWLVFYRANALMAGGKKADAHTAFNNYLEHPDWMLYREAAEKGAEASE